MGFKYSLLAYLIQHASQWHYDTFLVGVRNRNSFKYDYLDGR